MTAAESEYQSLFAFLGEDSTTVMVSLGVVIITGVGFMTARMSMRVTMAERRQMQVEQANIRIRKEL